MGDGQILSLQGYEVVISACAEAEQAKKCWFQRKQDKARVPRERVAANTLFRSSSIQPGRCIPAQILNTGEQKSKPCAQPKAIMAEYSHDSSQLH